VDNKNKWGFINSPVDKFVNGVFPMRASGFSTQLTALLLLLLYLFITNK